MEMELRMKTDELMDLYLIESASQVIKDIILSRLMSQGNPIVKSVEEAKKRIIRDIMGYDHIPYFPTDIEKAFDELMKDGFLELFPYGPSNKRLGLSKKGEQTPAAHKTANDIMNFYKGARYTGD